MMKQDSVIYEQAANLVTEYPNHHTVRFETPSDEVVELLNDFREKFSPDKLKSLNDDEILNRLFLTTDGNNDSLCYHLEFNPKLKRTFGSISGGSSFKFGLFQRQEDGKWITGAPKTPQVLSEAEALEHGRRIRNDLVKACEMIASKPLETIEEYEKLDDDLNSLIGKLATYAWVQKYFHLIFPDKFIGWYVVDWLKHILYGFGIIPSEKYYGMNGQLALIKKKTSYMSPAFQDICYTMFGEIRHFYRLGSSDETEHYATKWHNKNIVAVGWKDIGDLLNYIKNGSIDKEKLTDALVEHYYQTDKKTASRKAGEIKTFYETSSTSVITVMDGSQLLALVDDLSPYFYDGNENMAHQKSGVWHLPFDEADRLPVDEGYLTTCYEIKKPENLLFLYKKYYWSQGVEEDMGHIDEYAPLVFNTKCKSLFERNRILFGAPGTGKSYRLKDDCARLLSEGGEFERVTFHPDYTYSQFVGTYKPVTDSDGHIEYRFVPGPFMRVYVNALKSGRTDNPKPYLLIVEEINRAKVAAVFGDVFQLLDRDDDGVSEYEIQPSEDVRQFLASELGGTAKEYLRILLPNNMFIWATMNSADQGVFPMDTAFKRRWSFDYLGINEKDDMVTGHVVLGQGDDARDIEWNVLRRAINEKLTADFKINEDKLMGPFFIEKKYYKAISGEEYPEEKREQFVNVFKSKVIMYLFEDAAKQYKHKLFEGCEDTTKYSSICSEFDRIGIRIFGDSFETEFYNPQKER